MEKWPLVLRRYGRLTVTPQFYTLVKRFTSGTVQRDLRWLAPVFRFQIDYSPILTPDLFSVLEAFYMRHRGMGRLFLFQDWTRPDRAGEELGEGNGEQVEFKIYGDQADAVTVYVDGVQKTPGVDYTIDLSTGKITFIAAPAAGAKVTADVVNEWFRVAFNEDEMEQQRIGRGAGWLTRVVMEQDSVMPVAA